jgi:competence protein ComEA
MKTLLTLILAGMFSIASWAADSVNVNTATAEEIADGLKGVGQSKAEAIVDYRESNGLFMQIDELVNVKGIGIRTVDMNRGVIKLDGETILASSEE